ncbi:MAG: hypothetical protein VXY77_02125 [Pseudomonadota bacterium]|nr:hypothetical protein [Pseudomonadota bacterium]
MTIYSKATIAANRLRTALTDRASRCYGWMFKKSPKFGKALLSIIEDAFNTGKLPLLLAIYQLYILIGFKLAFTVIFTQASNKTLETLFARGISAGSTIPTPVRVTALLNTVTTLFIIGAELIIKIVSKLVSLQQAELLTYAKAHVYQILRLIKNTNDPEALLVSETQDNYFMANRDKQKDSKLTEGLQVANKNGSKFYSSTNYFIETVLQSIVLVVSTMFAYFSYKTIGVASIVIMAANIAAYVANQKLLKPTTTNDQTASQYLSTGLTEFATLENCDLAKFKSETHKNIKYKKANIHTQSMFDLVTSFLEKGVKSIATLILLPGVESIAALTTKVDRILEALKCGMPLLKMSSSVAETEIAYEAQKNFFKLYSSQGLNGSPKILNKGTNHTRKDWLLTTIPRKEHHRATWLNMSKDALLSTYYAMQLVIGSFFITQFLAHLSPLHNQTIISNIYGNQSMISILFNTVALKFKFLPTLSLSSSGIILTAIAHIAIASILCAGLCGIKQVFTKQGLLPNSDQSDENALFSIVTSLTLLLIAGPLFGLSSILSKAFIGAFSLSTPLWSILGNQILTPSEDKIEAAYKTITKVCKENGYTPAASGSFKDESEPSVAEIEAVKDILLGKETFVVDATAKQESDPKSITAHLI